MLSVGIIGLVVLGLLAAVLVAFVVAAAKGRLGAVLLAAGLLLLLVMIGGAALLAPIVLTQRSIEDGRPRLYKSTTFSIEAPGTRLTIPVSGPDSVQAPSGELSAVENVWRMNKARLASFAVLIAIVVVAMPFGALLVARLFRSRRHPPSAAENGDRWHDEVERRGHAGWAWAILLVPLVFLLYHRASSPAVVNSAARPAAPLQLASPSEADPPRIPLDGASAAVEASAAAAGRRASSGERPAWVDERPRRIGDRQRLVVVAGDYATESECQEATSQLLRLAAWERLQSLVSDSFTPSSLPTPAASELAAASIELHDQLALAAQMMGSMGLADGYLRGEIRTNEYLEQVERLPGEMLRLYTQVEFTPAFDAELRHRWTDLKQRERATTAGAWALGALAAVGATWGLLKFGAPGHAAGKR
jgi:hypothetical protein